MRIIDGKPEYRNAFVSEIVFFFLSSKCAMLFFLGRLVKSDRQRRHFRFVERIHAFVFAHRTTHRTAVHIFGKIEFTLFIVRSPHRSKEITFIRILYYFGKRIVDLGS
jgi:hypothetical protein